MSDPTNRPLWQTMAAARHGRPINNDSMLGQTCGHLYAAELRAIAGEMSDVFDLTGDAGRVFEWLLAEADRAEAGG